MKRWFIENNVCFVGVEWGIDEILYLYWKCQSMRMLTGEQDAQYKTSIIDV